MHGVHLSGVPWSCCPRTALARAIKQAEEMHGLVLQVGFETELHLSRPNSAVSRQSGQLSHAPVDDSLYADSLALDNMSPGMIQVPRHNCCRLLTALMNVVCQNFARMSNQSSDDPCSKDISTRLAQCSLQQHKSPVAQIQR